MNWEDDISARHRELLNELGEFRPTVRPQDRMLKGRLDSGGSSYYSSTDLRETAIAMLVAAEWLDRRAAEARAGVAPA